MKCQVTSTTRKLMISREVKVASYKEICGGEKIRVHIGYHNRGDFMIVKDNQLLEIPSKRKHKGESYIITQDWEVHYKFFSNYNIEPVWLDCGRNGWGNCVEKVI